MDHGTLTVDNSLAPFRGLLVGGVIASFMWGVLALGAWSLLGQPSASSLASEQTVPASTALAGVTAVTFSR
jgi:hypothetical protein